LQPSVYELIQCPTVGLLVVLGRGAGGDPFGVPWERRQAQNLKLVAYQVFKGARAIQGPDLGQPPYRPVVYEEVR
jgi:hypothetical protein